MSNNTIGYLPVDKEIVNLFEEFLEIIKTEQSFELPMLIEKANGDGHFEIILRRPLWN